MAEKITLTKQDRKKVWWRHQFLQGSWNYERMQNGGWCYGLLPALKELYPKKTKTKYVPCHKEKHEPGPDKARRKDDKKKKSVNGRVLWYN